MVEEKQQLKPFFRVLNTDLIGEKPISQALLKVPGVGFSLANAICSYLKIPKIKKAGSMSDEDAKRIEAFLKTGKDVPHWMLNRRHDENDGETKHLLASDLKYNLENDIKRLKKIKAYRGIRHALGQPTRGQRTRSHFRHGRAVGVQKTKIVKAAPAAGAKDKGKK